MIGAAPEMDHPDLNPLTRISTALEKDQYSPRVGSVQPLRRISTAPEKDHPDPNPLRKISTAHEKNQRASEKDQYSF